MSHKATTWLSDLPADAAGNSEFRVLFHLCDCHNPSAGCFPTQAYLLKVCGIANSTLNVALANLETKGLIRRHQSVDPRSRRQRPTRYILGFEMTEPQEPTPKTGVGNPPEPTPEIGDGADSDLSPEPTPIFDESRLRPAGDKPVKEPVINLALARQQAGPVLCGWADAMKTQGGYVPVFAIRPDQARTLLNLNLVTEADLNRHGVTF